MRIRTVSVGKAATTSTPHTADAESPFGNFACSSTMGQQDERDAHSMVAGVFCLPSPGRAFRVASKGP
eukprot:4251029-Alexandrium_andersonii.AAC.1